MRMRWFAVLILVGACGGSSKKTATPEPTPAPVVAEPEPTPDPAAGGQVTADQCRAALNHAVDIMLEGATPEQRAEAEQQRGAMIDGMIDECVKTATPAMLDCINRAARPDDLEGCEQ